MGKPLLKTQTNIYGKHTQDKKIIKERKKIHKINSESKIARNMDNDRWKMWQTYQKRRHEHQKQYQNGYLRKYQNKNGWWKEKG